MPRLIRCYAEGSDRGWEAICLDFDIAVQGESFEEVYESLNKAIVLYVEKVATLPPAEQEAFLNRQAPLLARLKWIWLLFRSGRGKGGPRDHHKARAGFQIPCPA